MLTEDSLANTLFFPGLFYQDINSLNKQIAQLQDFVRAKGSQSGRHLQTHSNTIVVSLQVGAGEEGKKAKGKNVESCLVDRLYFSSSRNWLLCPMTSNRF